MRTESAATRTGRSIRRSRLTPPPSVMRWLAVLAGGGLGSLARYGLTVAIGIEPQSFPWATLAVNVGGAFGLGLAMVLLTERLPPGPFARTFVGIGFFGAFTTFSTMAMEGVMLLDADRTATALLYWLLTLILGQMAGVYGMWLGRLDSGARERAR